MRIKSNKYNEIQYGRGVRLVLQGICNPHHHAGSAYQRSARLALLLQRLGKAGSCFRNGSASGGLASATDLQGRRLAVATNLQGGLLLQRICKREGT
jgi:hypothetical protein